MPKISVVDSWKVATGNADDAKEYSFTANIVYKFIRDAEDPDYREVIMSVKNVRQMPDGRSQIIPNVVFGEGTFWIPEESDIVYSDTIQEVTPVYIERKSLDHRPRPESKDPYQFEFFSTKTNKAFTIKVDQDQLISVTAKAQGGHGTYNYLGHIRGLNGETLTLQSLQNNNGVFYIEDIEIDVKDLKGIYFYKLSDIPYEEGMAKKAARQKKAAERKAKNAPKEEDKEASQKKADEPESVPEEINEELKEALVEAAEEQKTEADDPFPKAE